MSVNLLYLNTVINDRRRDAGSNSIDMTQGGFRAINSALQIWNEVHDWPWTIKKVNFNYNQGVDTYALDSIVTDFKFPLTLKYYKPKVKVAEFWMVSPLRFDSAYLWSRRFAIDVSAGVQTIRIKSIDGNNVSLNTATAYNQNGTWIGDGSTIAGVYTDQYEGYSSSSSVAFLFNGTTGTITNDGNSYNTFLPIDLTAYKNRSNIYFDIDFSNVTNLQSITFHWGTDSSNYYSATVTTDYLGNTFTTGWIKIKIPWSSIPTTVGTPTITSMKYLQVSITCSGSTNLGLTRIQNFFCSENIPVTITYYSTSMVTTSSGTQSQVFSNYANTTDSPLWSGRWDMATEPFINSVLETLFFMTGEISDMSVIKAKIEQIVQPLKTRYPSQRRYPTNQIVPDINYPAEGTGYREHWWPTGNND
jgi:hypothetical protein